MVQSRGLCLGVLVFILVYSRLAVPNVIDCQRGGFRFQIECFSFARFNGESMSSQEGPDSCTPTVLLLLRDYILILLQSKSLYLFLEFLTQKVDRGGTNVQARTEGRIFVARYSVSAPKRRTLQQIHSLSDIERYLYHQHQTQSFTLTTIISRGDMLKKARLHNAALTIACAKPPFEFQTPPELPRSECDGG